MTTKVCGRCLEERNASLFGATNTCDVCREDFKHEREGKNDIVRLVRHYQAEYPGERLTETRNRVLNFINQTT